MRLRIRQPCRSTRPTPACVRWPPARRARPETWVDCAQGLAQAGELVDGTGVHFWLAVDAVLGGRDLLPDGILALLDGGEVEVHQWRGWNNGDSVFVSNGDQPVLALQNHAALDGARGALRVEDAGGDALPSMDMCGNVSSHTLRFIDDNGAKNAGNGTTVELIVGGVEFLGSNIYSVEWDWRCTDGPWPENQATWVAFDNSL